MFYKKLSFSILMAALFAGGQQADAAYTIKDGKFVEAGKTATMPLKDHFEKGLSAIQANKWKEAAFQFRIVTTNSGNSPLAQEAYYYLGVAEYNLNELDIANDAFSDYLRTKNNPKYFQDAIQYKYDIAEKFANGGKKRMFGTKQLPKWASGRSLAIKIYDEVIAALPSNDLAARALYSKAQLHWDMREYREGIDNFMMVIKRFPKHELAPESYIAISDLYVEQSQKEFQNPDILAFAEINQRRFKHDFPRDARLSKVEANVLQIKENYALGLYNTGQFYERKESPKAAIIYYQNAIKQFPETQTALRCKERLNVLAPGWDAQQKVTSKT